MFYMKDDFINTKIYGIYWTILLLERFIELFRSVISDKNFSVYIMYLLYKGRIICKYLYNDGVKARAYEYQNQ